MSEIADILDRAADLIEPEGAWIKGSYALDKDGRMTMVGSPRAVCFCVEGALCHVVGGEWGASNAAEGFLENFLGQGIPEWNDAHDRTQAEVVAKLREAAAKVRTPQYALKNGRV